VAARAPSVSLRLPRVRYLLPVALLACAGCLTPPAERTDAEARRLGFAGERVRGAGFVHVVYRSPGPAASGDRLLHVYLGGDGSSRRALRFDPPDPTPSRPIALRLMALDPAPRVFLGRPGQHGAECHPRHWTTGRYGADVVESLIAALRSLAAVRDAPGLVLLGYSGGGTLAMLVAERMPEVRAVVTVAANLDVAAWTALHGATPLSDSLDPGRRPPLPDGIAQLHVLGDRDRNVPPSLVEAVIARQPRARTLRVSSADHACCWEAVWPAVLDELAALERSTGTGPGSPP
jgi:pimeloyl-ACP methyl ester carboxylesterase